mmetsp:Transcript_9961/g.26381  ORF Transcript_9961/g.26381 Transcript_9961/m.26381 type:complete len:125 (+) Transcript_9961:87-461(+)
MAYDARLQPLRAVAGLAEGDASLFNAEGFHADLRRRMDAQRGTLENIIARSEMWLLCADQWSSSASASTQRRTSTANTPAFARAAMAVPPPGWPAGETGCAPRLAGPPFGTSTPPPQVYISADE